MNLTRHLVVTAFGAFPGCPINPTEVLAQSVVRDLERSHALDGWEAQSRTLPTEWGSPAALVADIRTRRSPPDLLLSLGVDAHRNRLCIERFGVNRADLKRSDARGRFAPAGSLVEGGPDRLEGQLHRPPFSTVVEQVASSGRPVDLSDDAGRYLCNAVFYQLLDAFDAEPKPSAAPVVGFIHVPHIIGVSRDVGDSMALPEGVVLGALRDLIVGFCTTIDERSIPGSANQPDALASKTP